jgi:hypothetical protein
MGVVNMEDVAGYQTKDGKVLCDECGEEDGAKEGDFLFTKDIEAGDKIYFCDNCQKRL